MQSVWQLTEYGCLFEREQSRLTHDGPIEGRSRREEQRDGERLAVALDAVVQRRCSVPRAGFDRTLAYEYGQVVGAEARGEGFNEWARCPSRITSPLSSARGKEYTRDLKPSDDDR